MNPRILFLHLLAAGAALPLGGCVAGVAAGALGSAIGSATSGDPEGPPDPAAAREACTLRAAPHGEVRIIDVVDRGGSLRVFGTAGDGEARRSFQCDYRGGRISGFELRRITRR